MRKLEENHPPEQRIYKAVVGYDEAANELVEDQPQIIFKKAALLTLHTREVCEDCNIGWMSNLQEAVKPIILLLAKAAKAGIAVAVSNEDARMLAVWAEVTALTYELTSDGPRVGTADMGQRLRAGQPLPHSLVWAARNLRDYDLSLALAQLDVSATLDPRPGPPDRRALLVAIVYHCVTILVFIADSARQSPPPLPLAQWALLWPQLSGHVEYPSIGSVSGPELTEVFTHPGRWIPPVRVPIRRSILPPEVRHRS
jgi:hypothetical protein